MEIRETLPNLGQYKLFKKEQADGSHVDLTKMSMAQKREHNVMPNEVMLRQEILCVDLVLGLSNTSEAGFRTVR